MSDFSIYPSAIDGYQQLPLVIDGVSPVRAEDLNRYRSGIINIETTLGVDPQASDSFGEYSTVGERLEAIDEKILNITIPPTPSLDDVVSSGRTTGGRITAGGISIGTIDLQEADGTVGWDMGSGQMARVSLSSDSAFDAPSNISPGTTYILIIEQSVTVNTIWHSIFSFPNGVSPSSVAGGTTTIISFISYDGAKLYSIAQDNF